MCPVRFLVAGVLLARPAAPQGFEPLCNDWVDVAAGALPAIPAIGSLAYRPGLVNDTLPAVAFRTELRRNGSMDTWAGMGFRQPLLPTGMAGFDFISWGPSGAVTDYQVAAGNRALTPFPSGTAVIATRTVGDTLVLEFYRLMDNGEGYVIPKLGAADVAIGLAGSTGAPTGKHAWEATAAGNWSFCENYLGYYLPLNECTDACSTCANLTCSNATGGAQDCDDPTNNATNTSLGDWVCRCKVSSNTISIPGQPASCGAVATTTATLMSSNNLINATASTTTLPATLTGNSTGNATASSSSSETGTLVDAQGVLCFVTESGTCTGSGSDMVCAVTDAFSAALAQGLEDDLASFGDTSAVNMTLAETCGGMENCATGCGLEYTLSGGTRAMAEHIEECRYTPRLCHGLESVGLVPWTDIEGGMDMTRIILLVVIGVVVCCGICGVVYVCTRKHTGRTLGYNDLIEGVHDDLSKQDHELTSYFCNSPPASSSLSTPFSPAPISPASPVKVLTA
eukprot:TRINITY_DN22574_c0_g1_i1.p1 TRINITY_DN22574_c0_g1~~TRINITY_DN22574_c0_g1_i1.p1  ORF type:complete len:511 (+),score=78.71 TRINITY_DN22574_c0_g1_i1:50-1582(+)